MSTLKDVFKVYKDVEVSTKIFGCTGGFKSECDKRFKQFGKVVMREQNVAREKARFLPKETELGEWAEEEFTKLKQWLSSQDPDFKF